MAKLNASEKNETQSNKNAIKSYMCTNFIFKVHILNSIRITNSFVISNHDFFSWRYVIVYVTRQMKQKRKNVIY